LESAHVKVPTSNDLFSHNKWDLRFIVTAQR
jgi:hypothetical protein